MTNALIALHTLAGVLFYALADLVLATVWITLITVIIIAILRTK